MNQSKEHKKLTLSFSEIVDEINRLNIPKDEFSSLPYYTRKEHDDPKYERAFGRVKVVDSHGGEGEGERYWHVLHFVDQDVYIKLQGFYTSYDGTDYSNYEYEEVKPKKKTITVYE